MTMYKHQCKKAVFMSKRRVLLKEERSLHIPLKVYTSSWLA